jgi:hypothetical protein
MTPDYPSQAYLSVWVNDDAYVQRTFQAHQGDMRTVLTWRSEDRGSQLVQLWLTSDAAQELFEALTTLEMTDTPT